MSRSPFTFYRGAARIMAADLALTPSSGIQTQLCGDAHLANFGVYASPERRLVFNLNDFDETLPGPREWDVKRLAASLIVAARHIRSEPLLLIPLRDLQDKSERDETGNWIVESFEEYRQSVPDELDHLLGKYRIVDFAIKVVGVGSVGTWCAILLLEGRDRHDPFFLQIKQANMSVLENHMPKIRYQNSAERVVQGQRLMQSVSDIFLGWTESKSSGNHYYWRQLKDWKGSPDVENVDHAQLKRLGSFRGRTLARAHARSGDAIAISSYLDAGKISDKAITEFSARYADQNERDYESYMTEIRGGRLEVSDVE